MVTLALLVTAVEIIDSIFMFFLLDFDMKKDLDSLIAEERAEIISKYDKVSKGMQSSVMMASLTKDLWSCFGHMIHLMLCTLTVDKRLWFI